MLQGWIESKGHPERRNLPKASCREKKRTNRKSRGGHQCTVMAGTLLQGRSKMEISRGFTENLCQGNLQS